MYRWSFLCLLGVCALALLGCQPPPTAPVDPIAPFQPILDQYVAVWNGADVSSLDSIVDQNVVRRVLTGPLAQSAGNLNELKQLITGFRGAFPDLEVRLLDTIAQGDKTAVRWSVSGTNTGEGMWPPTGQSIQLEGVSFSRYAGGKLVEELVYFDTAVMATQLGYTMTPPAAPPEEGAQ